MKIHRRQHHAIDRGFSLVAVLVVIGCAVLVVTSLLFVAQAEVAGTARAVDAVQARALAWSGVQVVMGRLNEQRDLILEGRSPELDERYVIYENESVQGVVRLLALGPGGESVVAEAGKLDLDHLEEDMLTETGLIDVSLDRSVISYRDEERPVHSVAELLRVPGVSAETLYGPLEDLALGGGAAFETARPDGAPAGRVTGEGLRGLADVVTVYGFEPALQGNGKLRINLNVQWSAELDSRVEERFGQEAAGVLSQIMQSGTTFDSEAKIFQVLRFFEVPLEDWPDIADAFTSESGDYHFGRLDINTAPYEALVALPGLEPEQAAEIVQVRDELSPEHRATIVWPALEGIIEPEAYDELAGRITTRSWTYRLRLAAAEEDLTTDRSSLTPGPSPRGRGGAVALIYEVVIDLSAPRPRVAYLRDVTMLETACTLALNASLDEIEWSSPPELGEDELLDPQETRLLAAETDDGEWDVGPAAGSTPFDDVDESMIGEPPDPLDSGAGAPVAPASAPPPQRRRIGRWQTGESQRSDD